MKLDPMEHVELRFLEQGRGTISDGRDWLRMSVGIFATLVTLFWIADIAEQHALSIPLFVAIVLPVMLGIVGVAGWWCVAAGKVAAQRRIAMLRSAAAA